ncbi:hypothetical protein K492DRAFT_178794 [Lichtheimia hyalospora FSU 10163]|nr:hypothetical protein K492DRAFT_178794 [Lichtheimia hyalospora FSU 10163]
METPIEVLRIEHSAISKELSRFRACDSETRCLYCREWSQYVYKKHFIWSAKTQEDVTMEDPERLLAGKYQINLLNGTTPSKQKERSPKLSERFEKLLETQSESSSDATLTEEIISACTLWQTLPSSLSALPPIFEPVQFNPYPDAIPLLDDPKEPSQLLDPLIIERQTLCLPAEGFHLLKNLTGDILMSHSQPTCAHTRPSARSPAELEMERAIYNERLESVTTSAMNDLERALDHSWRHLSEFLQRLLDLERERNALMGRRSKDSVDRFADAQHLPSSFQEHWDRTMHSAKKKRHDVAAMDNAVQEYFDQLAGCVERFHNEFAMPRLDALQALIQKLWDLVVPTIQKMADRMASHEQQDERHMENCKAVSASLRGLHPADDVNVAVRRIQTEMDRRIREFRQDADAVINNFTAESKATVAGRLEKLAQKDFKKRVKRAENGYNALRQYFKYEVTQKIFPEPLFCKFCLVCIEALMQEGEVMEAVTIEKEVKRFLESHKNLVRQRQLLLNEFEDGVQTGRRELAGVLGKLFLKEGMRIQGENLALKRQNMLLQSMKLSDSNDVQSTSSSSKKKNKKKKKKKKATTSSHPTINNDAASISANESSRAPSTCSSPKPALEKHVSLNSLSDEQGKQSMNDKGKPEISSQDQLQQQESQQDGIVDTNDSKDDTTKEEEDLPVIDDQQEEEGWMTVTSSKRKKDNNSNNRESTMESKLETIPPSTPTTPTTIPDNSPSITTVASTISSKQPDTFRSAEATNAPSPPQESTPSIESSKPIDTHQEQQSKLTQQSQPPGFDNDTSDQITSLSHDQLVALVTSLRQENGQLMQAVTAMRQEMGMVSRQYAEMMALSREREEQMAQLYETRRRADMEEARRHISALEAKVSAMQQHDGLSPIKCGPPASIGVNSSGMGGVGSGVMAGFGNQDLFAGYREEMRSQQYNARHLWQNSIRMRCGNCGGLGHASSDCKDACRYCGSNDHLSESCQFIS